MSTTAPKHQIAIPLIALTLILGVTACLDNGGTVGALATSASPTASVPTGTMAARIYFQIPGTPATNPASFPSPAAGASSVQANTIYQTDSDTSPTPLATSVSSSSWPKWISSVTLGLSGSGGTSPNCAAFSTSAESAVTCGTGAPPPFCGTPVANQFRVSEYDCSYTGGGATAIGQGTGAGTDPVYIQAVFNTTNGAIGATENIMAVLQYAASSLFNAPSDPSQCFQGANGTLDASNPACADMNWNIFFKGSPSATAPTFMLLVPPTTGFLAPNTVSTTLTSYTQILTKQIIIPLAANEANMTQPTLQISRINALNVMAGTPSATTFSNICTSDSPLCLGMILYSLTFYRI